VQCILYDQIQLGMAFAGTQQCDHGAKQAQMPIYSKGGPEALRSCDHEYASFEQPFGLVPL
jgi:hypothetical protein